MQSNTVQQPPSMLADPEQVALIRDLYAQALKANAQHLTYETYVGGPVEHVWKTDVDRVSVFDGFLFYERHRSLILKARVTHPRQVGQLLAAIGVLPQRFIGGAS